MHKLKINMKVILVSYLRIKIKFKVVHITRNKSIKLYKPNNYLNFSIKKLKIVNK